MAKNLMQLRQGGRLRSANDRVGRGRVGVVVFAALACLFLWPSGATTAEVGGTNCAGPNQACLYVAPWGSDRNSGTSAAPFQSLARARDAVRRIDHNMHGNITVYLEGGTYRLPSTLRLDASDSGMNGYDVIWTGAPGATAIISGAIRIGGWRLSDHAKNIWVATVPKSPRTRQLYVNEDRAFLARGPLPTMLTRWWTMYHAASTVMSHWRNPTEIDFVYLGQLSIGAEAVCPLASIEGRSIWVATPCWENSNFRKADYVGWNMLGNPDYVENAYEVLDQPGEFPGAWRSLSAPPVLAWQPSWQAETDSDCSGPSSTIDRNEHRPLLSSPHGEWGSRCSEQ